MIHTMGEMQARVTQIVTFLDALGRAESQLGAAPDVDMEGRRPPLLDYRIAHVARCAAVQT